VSLRQVSVLFGLELCLAGPVPEHVERLFLRHRNELGCGSWSRRLGRGDLGRLVERDVAVLQRRAQLCRSREHRGGRRYCLCGSHRRAGDARELGCVTQPARQSGDPEIDAPAGAGIGRKQSARDLSRQQLGLKMGVGFVEQLDCLIDERTIHGSNCDDEVGRKTGRDEARDARFS